MDLIIVESPTKSKTIQKFLGDKYKIMSSFGHVRDLPKRELGVDVEKNFELNYVIPTKAKKVVSELKKESSGMGCWIFGSNTRTPTSVSSWQNAAISLRYRLDPQTTTDFILFIPSKICNMEAPTGFEPVYKVLQTSA